jgi:hypothetical protein
MVLRQESRHVRTWKGYDIFKMWDENGVYAWYAYPVGSTVGTPPSATNDYWAVVRDWCTQHPNTLTD